MEKERFELQEKGLTTEQIGIYYQVKNDIRQLLFHLGLNVDSPELCNTPKRVAEMILLETCSGLYAKVPEATVFPNKQKYNEMVVETNIKVHSLCEHHLLPFIGVAHVAYIPGENLVGLSKLIRIVDYYARRPQVQERLTDQIGRHLQNVLGHENVAVILSCTHLCTTIRGVKNENCITKTSFLGGNFFKPEVRAELLTLIGK